MSDPDNEFFYDVNGNMNDGFDCKIVTITYNLLNLSGMVLFRNCIRTINHPSGLPWGESEGANVQSYKYNGKEFIEMHGYDTYDYGARGYYPAIQRFTSIDPLAEKYYSISPYAFYSNNSINSIDLDGMDDYKINSDGRIWLWRETKDKTDRLIAIGNKNVVNVDKARKILNNNIIVTDKIILPSLSKTNADDESVTGVTTLMFENKNILFEVHSHSKEN